MKLFCGKRMTLNSNIIFVKMRIRCKKSKPQIKFDNFKINPDQDNMFVSSKLLYKFFSL